MPWISQKVRSVNLQFDQGLMVHGTSLIGVTLLLCEEECTTCIWHLNSQDKRMMTHLIANRICDDHVPCAISIPVITHARNSPV